MKSDDTGATTVVGMIKRPFSARLAQVHTTRVVTKETLRVNHFTTFMEPATGAATTPIRQQQHVFQQREK